MQTCQPSRFWRDSPAFLPDVPRPAKSWKCPAFCTKSDFFARAICNAAPVPKITQLNVITEIPFDFSQKYQMVPRPNSRATVYSIWNAIDFCRLYTSKQISMRALPTVPLFAGKSRFFTRNVPLKTFSRLAGLHVFYLACLPLRAYLPTITPSRPTALTPSLPHAARPHARPPSHPPSLTPPPPAPLRPPSLTPTLPYAACPHARPPSHPPSLPHVSSLSRPPTLPHAHPPPHPMPARPPARLQACLSILYNQVHSDLFATFC